MGYQPKSYRKFLATSVGAVMAASAILPVAASAASNDSTFSDVPAANAAQVSWAVGQNIIKGYPDGTFKPYNSIDRAHAAVMIAQALKLDVPSSVTTAPFNDVKATDTYAPYIQAVKDAKIFNGDTNGNFAPDQTLTREQMATALVHAFNLKDNGANVEVKDMASVGASHQANVQILADLGITVLPNGNFNPAGNNTRINLVSFLYQVNEYLNAAPAVTSVSAVNAKQIKVVFNKAVQAGTLTGGAEVLGDYSVDGVNPSRVTLAEDKQSVVLTFGNNTADLADKLGKYLEVDVSGLKTATGEDVAEYKAPFYFDDTTAPTATVSSKATTATVTFSELLATNGGTLTGATVSLDGVAGASYTVKSDADTVKGASSISLAGLAAGTHTISIVGATDLAGNKLPVYNGTVNVSNDTVAPTVTSLTAEGNNVRVKFSEPVVDNATLVNGGGTNNAVKISANGVYLYAQAADAVDNDGTEFLINATSFIPAGSDFTNTTVTVAAGSEDASGNPSVAYSKTLTVTKDTTAPKVVDQFVDGKDLVVEFGEAVGAGSVALTGASTPQIQFTDADGVVYASAATTLSGVSYGYDVNGDGDTSDAGENDYLVLSTNQSSITSGSTLKAGTYKLTLPAKAVADSATNDNSVATVTFTVGSASNVLANVHAAASQVSPGVLEYTFSDGTDPVDLTTAQLKASNFTIDGEAVPSDSTIYFYGNKHTVRVELPANYIAATGSRTLSVANIADKDGNTLSKTAADIQTNISLTENVQPKALSLTLLDAKHVTVQMSEELAATPTTGIELWVNGTKVDTSDVSFSLVADSYTHDTILKLTTATKSISNNDTIVVKFTASNDAADAAGNTAVVGQVSK